VGPSGWQFKENMSRKEDSTDWRARSTDESGSAAARPESGPVVRCYDRQGPAKRGCSRVPTAAREKEVEDLPVPWNGGFGLLRPRADASSGLASRADPTLYTKELNSFNTSSGSK